jgi:hypothetical protein
VVFYAQDGSVTVRDPDNHLAYKGRARGDFVAVPVKPGMAGKVWSLVGKYRNLWFLNLPTVLSASPKMVFVPQDVAQQDGLTIVSP